MTMLLVWQESSSGLERRGLDGGALGRCLKVRGKREC